jgi:peptidoglycan-N-acetylglucosamine deacetylase
MSSQRCAVSIDLDEVACYYRIHGLGEAPAELASIVLENAVPRAAEWLARHGAVATWFVVGQDVDAGRPGAAGDSVAVGREILRALHRGGHELGNHSYSHPYQLARMDEVDVALEIGECDRVLRQLTGSPVRGFRAPGYDLSATALRILEERGYCYDSSIFPAPPYYLAKAVVMGALALRGRPSGAVLTDPRALFAPRRPYRLDREAPWRRGTSELIELPVTVTPYLRVPVIGTSLLLAPPLLRECLLRAIAGEPLFNFELHGIDFVDAEADGIPGELVDRQPDLRLPVKEKLARLDAIMTELARGFDFTTLAEVAEAVAASDRDL